ncbi:MAG: hypothetical protein EZS28_031872 [Streblomastix strix]|uniref:Uncharacterized protein n=1 Tax=Streblomastix strix TaxID=222440 RepID=A0A5J4URK9_9EUKA|nr:MAG: hypothetical protein EZS28_031872 [Streblomastix strix]
MSVDESRDGGSESTSPSRMDENCKDDRHTAGEELFRRMAGRIGLVGEAINKVNDSSSMDIWWKRRAGWHVLCVYMEDIKTDLDEIFMAKPDIILSNSLTW